MSDKENVSHMDDLFTLKRSRAGHQSHITRLYTEAETLMSDRKNRDNILYIADKLKQQFERFVDAHKAYVSKLDNSLDKQEADEVLHRQKQGQIEFDERLSEWLRDKDKPDPESHPLSQLSLYSHHSSKSEIKFKEALIKQKIAGLKQKQLQQQQNLERQQQELQRNAEALRIKDEVEQAELEISIWRDTEHALSAINQDFAPPGQCEDDDMDQHAQGGEPTEPKRNYVPEWLEHYHKPPDPNFGYVPQDASNFKLFLHQHEEISKQQQEAFNNMALAVKQSFNMPQPKILSFNGCPTEYWKFINNFEANVASQVQDDRIKLCYLIQYTEGEVKESIEDCVILRPTEGYNKAREILHKRYGQPHVIAHAYLDQLTGGPPLRTSDAANLMKLSLQMQRCQLTLTQMGYVADINNSDSLLKIVRRLPMHLRSKWVDRADSIIEHGTEPNFMHLTNFIEDKARAANTMYGKDLGTEVTRPGFKAKSKPVHNTIHPKVTTLTTQAENKSSEIHSYDNKSCENKSSGRKDSQGKGTFQRFDRCIECQGSHHVSRCEVFLNKSFEDRKAVLRQKKLCDNCLRYGHFSIGCMKQSECTKEGCTRRHHTLLHPPPGSYRRIEDRGSQDVHKDINNNNNEKGLCTSTGGGHKVCLRIVPVRVTGKVPGKIIETYALLDDGSDVSLCTKKLVDQLDLEGTPKNYSLTTVNKESTTRHGLEVGLLVKSLDNTESVELDRVWTVDRLPISKQSIPQSQDVARWPHLYGVVIPEIEEQEISLLIGSDVPEVFWALEERRGDRKDPYAVRSLLGWTLMGPTGGKIHKPACAHVNFQQFGDEMLHHQVENFWKTEFNDSLFDTKTSLSVEDKRALAMMQDTVTKSDGHYELGLPWRHNPPYLPDNRFMAETRLRHLKRRLINDKQLHDKYTSVVEGYISNCYAKKITKDNMKMDDGLKWYLPHHPVIHPQKRKIRVVFDCAAKYKGTSLNDQLMQGPDQTNSLVGVLNRFRQQRVALVADVEAMFHQVKVRTEDCGALRFLWWTDGNLDNPPDEYQMLVHIFGATSSPSCAGFALRKTAEDNKNSYDLETVNTVYRNFYVDDCLTSVRNSDQAGRLASQLCSLLEKGGFRLTKWISSSREVLKNIPDTERASSVVDLDLEGLPTERALGVIWDVNSDTFKFRAIRTDKPVTRRGILSVVSSMYDPLGLAAPVTLPAKMLLQGLCKQKLGWDEAVSSDDVISWNKWMDNLMRLPEIEIERCFLPSGYGTPTLVQLHSFADASEHGYGSVCYIRFVNEQGSIHCVFVMGKSRVAPLKPITIPRLELSAAVVAVKLSRMIKEELDLSIHETIYWTDSMTVLQYIGNESRRFKTFVANRLAIIHESSKPSDWRHVSSEKNPADHASRGIQVHQQEKLDMWVNGPEFLWKQEACWPDHPVTISSLHSDEPELKKEATTNFVHHESKLDELISRYSSWSQLQISFVWLLRFKYYCYQRYLKKVLPAEICKVIRGPITVTEFRVAAQEIVGYVQHQAFPTEVAKFQRLNEKADRSHNEERAAVKILTSLRKLNPIMEGGLLKVGGRLERAPISYDAKHPIILPSRHHVTDMIIRHYHVLAGHSGHAHILSILRTRYWIISGAAAIKRELSKCFHCKRRNSPKGTQQMAPLPAVRLIANKPPFTYVGVDYFGPLYVKHGRGTAKRYGCLFTCFTTRAIHIEIAHSLEMDSFLGALNRFMSRRGKPDKLFSDNATNFRGGDRELTESLLKWNQHKLTTNLAQKDIEWNFNPPYASHMGGVWERMIRSTRRVLKALLTEQLVSDETLHTFMVEVEKILNDRPLTVVSDDIMDSEPLSPSKILLLRDNSCVPPGIFNSDDKYCRRWWRQAQYMANIFWKRWLREYLPTLQERQKWLQPKKNLRVNDLVLVAEENSVRGQWPLGRIVEAHADKHGHVRSVKVRIGGSIKVRPIHKLCFLEGDITPEVDEAS